MIRFPSSRGLFAALAWAAFGGTFNVAATAAECRLSVSATDSVLMPGESTQIGVAALFPATGYAFASAEFDVAADEPSWTFASDGVIAGANVAGAEAGQDHDPFAGEFADPSNPLRIWTGIYTPDSYDPKLIEVEATPSAFSYYPSELTGSVAECDADPGRKWLLINPIKVSDALVAPGPGTAAIGGHGDDVLIGGRTGFDGAAQELLFGFLAPEGQRISLAPDMPPTDLTLEVEVQEDPHKMFKFKVSFPPDPAGSTYDMQPDWPLADTYEYIFSTFSGQTVRVRILVTNDIEPLFNVERLPDAYSTRVHLDRRAKETRVISRFEYDETVMVIAPDGKRIEADVVEVRACQNNLRQLGLGLHAVHVAGTGSMQVGFGDGSVRFMSDSVNH